MKKSMNRTLWISIISSIIFILLGIILVSHPETSLVIMSYTVCILLGANGVYQLIMGYTNTSLSLFDGFSGGILSIILGILILIKPNTLSIVIPIAIGLWFIISSSYKLRIALALRSIKESIWFLLFVMALLMMVCGIILIFNPLSGMTAITITMGVLIIIYSLIDIVEAIMIKKNMKLLDNWLHEEE